ncbi:hypothetical protein [Candidatus Nitrospira salsa]
MSMTALVEIQRLHQQFIEDLNSTPALNNDQREVLLNGLTSIVQIFYVPAVNQPVRGITDAERALLKVCATSLPSEEELTPNDIEAIRLSIRELQEQVEKAEVSLTLKKILLELIRLSEDAIARYNIHGARGLKKAFKRMLAEVTELYYLDKKEQENIKNSSTWKKVLKHLHKFDVITARLMKYQPMIEKVFQVLLGNNADNIDV